MRPLAFALALLASAACQAATLFYGGAGLPPSPPDVGQWAEVYLAPPKIHNAAVVVRLDGNDLVSSSGTALNAHWFQSTGGSRTQIGYGWITAHILGPYLSPTTPLALEQTGELRPSPSNPTKSQERWLYNGADVWADVVMIPEPSTAWLLVVGAVGLVRRR